MDVNSIEHYTPIKDEVKPFHQIKCSQSEYTSNFTNQANYEMDVKNVEHYTPTKDELKPFHQIKCSQSECTSIFTNQANYEMHLEKHHRLAPAEKPKHLKLFYCPELHCMYNYNKSSSKHFKNIKYLRQHYQKVHLSKNFICAECHKAFGTETQLIKHQKEMCGKQFVCNECSWSYESMEALLTHGKRKGHSIKKTIATKKGESKVAIKPVKKFQMRGKLTQITKQREAKEIQVDFCPKMLCATSVQTDQLPDVSGTSSNSDLSHALDDIHSLLRDIETQTEPFLSSTSADDHNYLDQMLCQSSHMYTQTCDDFLNELGLADIQTQTNWNSSYSPNNANCGVQFTSTATSTNPCIHDELLVSTETQTSFTQCLLNSCADTETSTPPISFGSLYHTQHTQTCDPILESFDFGGQASDLIDGFQSTYTQT